MSTKKGETREAVTLRVSNSLTLANNIVTKKSNKSQPVHLENGQVIGRVVGNTFEKSVKGSIHFLKNPPSIAFDICSLNEAESLGATKIQVTDQENGYIYIASIKHIFEKGMRRNHGYGEQIALSMNGWIKRMPGVVYQRSLFGGQDVSE